MGDVYGKAALLKALEMPKPYNTFAAIGDSITQQDHPNGDGWFNLSLYRSGKGKYITNSGVGGNKTDQMLARIDADVITMSPTHCFVMGGANDITAGYTIATTVSNIEAMVKKLLNAKIVPVLMSITPRRQDDTYNYAANSEKINYLLRNMALKYRLQFIDVRSCLIDPASGMLQTALSKDLIHPNVAGSRVMATAVEAQFYKYLPDYGLPLCNSNASAHNLLQNGLFITDTNSDGTPDSWTKSGTGAVSLTASEDGVGNWVTVTNTSTGNFNINQYHALTENRFAVGDVLNISGEFKSENVQSGTMQYSIQLTYNGSGATTYATYKWTTDISNPAKFSADFIVPAGTAGITTYITANGGTGSVSVRRLSLVNLTQNGLL